MKSVNRSSAKRGSINMTVKLLLILEMIGIFTLGLYSCHCTEMLCYGADDMGHIEMLNFSQAEVESTFLID